MLRNTILFRSIKKVEGYGAELNLAFDHAIMRGMILRGFQRDLARAYSAADVPDIGQSDRSALRKYIKVNSG